MTVLAAIPNISPGRLPTTYTAAKLALKECTEIDECKKWANKAKALASYAKQAGDNDLRKMADRIQARAIRRAGELLQEIEPSKGGRLAETREGTRPSSRSEAARNPGLSEYQRKTALRVGNVPGPEFESAVGSDNPPTVTALAKNGTQSVPEPIIDLAGRTPEEFQEGIKLFGLFDYLVRGI